jgi:hypothetical protein
VKAAYVYDYVCRACGVSAWTWTQSLVKLPLHLQGGGYLNLFEVEAFVSKLPSEDSIEVKWVGSYAEQSR